MLLLVGLTLFWYLGYSWLSFCYFILLPDLAMIGYLANKQTGSIMYNVTHNYILPLILLAFYPLQPNVLMLALIWVIHISFDRALGYGLKSPHGFKKTHLAAE
ncbi:DUF4260 family protein [Serratia marcescens]|nr:DUF4260 family protein [Serratia marcescens]